MLGILLGFGSAIAFAANAIITRRGVLRISSNYVANVSILTGPVLSFLAALVTGDIFQLGQFPWKAYLCFAVSGVIHFAFGRTWAYKSVQLVGSTRSNIVTSLSPIVSVTADVIIVGERINTLMLLGILCSLSSPFITLLKEQTVTRDTKTTGGYQGKEVDRRTLYLGMFYGLGAAVFWGSSIIFVKLGLENGGSPIAGNLIAYSTASIAIIPSLLNRNNKKEMLAADRKSLHLALLTGLTTNIAQLFRYLALQYGSVILVTAVIRTSPLGVLLLAFIFNRQYESFSRWVLLSNALLMAGTIMVLKA